MFFDWIFVEIFWVLKTNSTMDLLIWVMVLMINYLYFGFLSLLLIIKFWKTKSVLRGACLIYFLRLWKFSLLGMLLIDSFHGIGGVLEISYVFDFYQVILFWNVVFVNLFWRTLNITVWIWSIHALSTSYKILKICLWMKQNFILFLHFFFFGTLALNFEHLVGGWR